MYSKMCSVNKFCKNSISGQYLSLSPEIYKRNQFRLICIFFCFFLARYAVIFIIFNISHKLIIATNS